ncbi:MAG: transposase [Dehalococcoidia bacterium]
MKYTQDIHHRRSVRLKGYDYSRHGWYFITICTHDRLPILGEIVGEGSKPVPDTRDETVVGAGSKPARVIDTPEMVLNENGEIVEQTWFDLVNHVPNIRLHEFVVMPNHIHGIIETVGDETSIDQDVVSGTGLKRAGLEPAPTGGMVRKRASIPEIVRQLKTFSARRINRLKNTTGAPVWQRNYYEHIIRDGKSYRRILEYIRTNPLRWRDDEYYEYQRPV